MSFTINLNSTNIVNARDTTDDFEIDFDPPIYLYNKDNYKWAVGLVKAIGSYSFYNISSSLFGNADFRWIDELAVVHDFTIPDGNYNIYQLSDAIQQNITIQGGTGSNISIVPNFPELKIKLVITPGSLYEVDLSVSNFYKLLGFTDAQALSGNIISTTQGDNKGDITNGVNALFINCSLVVGSWENSESSNIIHSYVPEKPTGAELNIIPQKVIYIPIKEQTDFIRRIRMWQTDNRDRRVDFNGENWNYMLHFKLIEL